MGQFELLHYPDAATLAEAAARAWLEWLKRFEPGASSPCVALSGGRIARDFFAAAARTVRSQPELLRAVHFFWADERCVPPDHPDSNFRLARQLLLEPAGVPASHIHRLRGEAPPKEAAQTASAELAAIALPAPKAEEARRKTEHRAPKTEDGGRRTLRTSAFGLRISNDKSQIPNPRPAPRSQPSVPAQGSVPPAAWPVLDLVFLGMGEDGHIASLFPRDPAADSAQFYRAVTAPKPPPWRITLGYGVLAAARQVWVLVSGPGKEAALRESLWPGGRTPLARLLRLRPHTRIVTDLSAEV